MTTIKNSMKHLLFAVLCSCTFFGVVAQNVKTAEIPARPKFNFTIREVKVATIDNIVTRSFTLLKSVDEVGAKVAAIQEQIKGSIPDISQTLQQIDDCNAALNTIGSSSPALVDDITNMISKIKDLHIPLLKIPLALKELNEARKAIQYCISYAKYLISSAIPGIRKQTSSPDQIVISKN